MPSHNIASRTVFRTGSRTVISPTLALLAVLFSCSLAPLDAQVRIRLIDDPTPVQASPTKLSVPEPALVLPRYDVDLTNSDGQTTLYAVRNASSEAVRVEVRYYGLDANPADATASWLVEQVDLAPHQTVTANLRDKQPPPSAVSGYVLFDVVEPLNAGPSIAGDYFRVDPSNDFASGGALLSAASTSPAYDFCLNWHARFFAGGGFDGGTRMSFFLLANPTAGDRPAAFGDVYDEAGNLRGTVEVTSGDYAFDVVTTELNLPATFGTIEWSFAAGVVGHVATEFSASGRYSVGTPATCADAAVEPVGTLPDLSGDFAASLAGLLEAILNAAELGLGVYDPETMSWTLQLTLADQTIALTLQVFDAQGDPMAEWQEGITASVSATGVATGPTGSVDFDLLISGLDDDDATCTIDGSAAISSPELSGTATINNLTVVKSEEVDYPVSGTVVVFVDGLRVTLTFNGSQFASGTVSGYGVSYGFTVNLETGEVIY